MKLIVVILTCLASVHCYGQAIEISEVEFQKMTPEKLAELKGQPEGYVVVKDVKKLPDTGVKKAIISRKEFGDMPQDKRDEILSHPELYEVRDVNEVEKVDNSIQIEEIKKAVFDSYPEDKKNEIRNNPKLYKIVE